MVLLSNDVSELTLLQLLLLLLLLCAPVTSGGLHTMSTSDSLTAGGQQGAIIITASQCPNSGQIGFSILSGAKVKAGWMGAMRGV